MHRILPYPRLFNFQCEKYHLVARLDRPAHGRNFAPELLSRSVAGDQFNILLLEDQRIVRSLSVITHPRGNH